MADAARELIIIDVQEKGVSETDQKSGKLLGTLDRLDATQGKVAASSDKSSAAHDRAAAAQARLDAAMAKASRELDAAARYMALHQAATEAASGSLGRMAEAQARAAQVAAQASRQQQAATNDNVQALQRESSAYEAAGKFALAHPLLVAAGSVAAARALSGLATSAAGSLGAASASTAAFAQGATSMGPAVVAAATVASRGLGLASTAATAAAGGFGVYAEKVSGITTATGLMSRVLGGLPGAVGPAVLAFLGFEAARAAISKAGDDLDRLIQLGEKARGLDLAAPFVKSFEALGPKIQATTDQMDRALQQASNFVKERYGQTNGALSAVSSLYTSGAFGADKPAAMSALETASNAQEKVRATLDAIRELQERGQEFAALDLTEKLFGPDVVERIRTGQASISQIVADLQSVYDKEVLKQDQVDRALELNKNISDTKQAISDAVAVTFDFSSAAMAANEAWLKVLQTVLLVINQINAANQASSDFVGTTVTTMINGLKSAGSAAADLAAQYGVIAKKQAQAEVQGPPEAAGPAYKITGRSFPYTFGPELPKQAQAAAGAAKQAGQAAQQAVSSYDNLIQRTKDRIDELDLETRSVGQSNEAVIKLKLAHDLERAAKKDGITISEQMRAENDRLGTSLAASTEALAHAKRGLELTREAQRELADDFSQFADDVILGGKKIGQAFADLSKTFASSSLKALLTGQGGLAGLFGTGAEKSGDIGGLLGGKFNLGSLFGGGSDAAGSPLPGAQGPSLPSSSLFGGLFDHDKIEKALSGGAESGIGSALSNALKPSKAGGGILSSPLGQGLGAVAAGASVGYSAQSPLMGGLSGALAGAMTGNPLIAVAGGIAGIAGGSLAHKPSRKKDRDHERRERSREFAACLSADGLVPVHG